MTGAILVSILAVACAAAVVVGVLVSQRPAEGWVAWVRDSVRAWRSDELSWTDGAVDEEGAGGLGALYLMSEPGNAYATPEEIGGQLGTRLVASVEQRAEASRAGTRRGHGPHRPSRAGA